MPMALAAALRSGTRLPLGSFGADLTDPEADLILTMRHASRL